MSQFSFSSVTHQLLIVFNLFQFISALFQSRRKSLINSHIRMEKNLLLTRKSAPKIQHFQDNDF